MDKLEKYLDQVCRGLGGPLEMRQHVRQELREHLLDAIAQHKAAGLSEEAAIDKALAEFGKPEDVGSELEATHGHRMTWILDKAMQWKEMTMKAKWLWMTWTYLGLIAVIALEVLFVIFLAMFIVPRFAKLQHDGFIDVQVYEDLPWMRDMFDALRDAERHALLICLGIVVVWGLFEWFVRSENKHFMRLSVLGTAALALLVVVIMLAGSLVIAFCLGMPAMMQIARPYAEQQLATIDAELTAAEQAAAKKNWDEAEKHASTAKGGAARLLTAGPAIPSLANNRTAQAKLREQVGAAHEQLVAALTAIQAKDAARADAALTECRKAIAPVREAAKKPAR